MSVRSLIASLVLRTACSMLCVGLSGLVCPAISATLRPFAQVHGKTVHLSDLFAGLEQGQDVTLGDAPEAGQRLVIGHAQLQAIAGEFNVSWDLTQGDPTTVLERPGHLLDRSAVMAAVRNALNALGLAKDDAVVCDRIDLPYIDDASQLSVEASSLDASTGRFEATLVVTVGDERTYSARLAGNVVRLESTVVPTRRVAANEILGPADVTTIQVASNRRPTDAISIETDAIGLTSKTSLSPGQPFRQSDLRLPDLVTRGAPVVMRLSGDGIEVSAQGVSMENGAAGSRIHVLNVSSKAVLVAWVTGANQVRVDPSMPPSVPISPFAARRMAGQ